jgi:hypothetical protein
MKTEGKQEFTTVDIGNMYEKAYWKKPANMADVFAKSAQRLYFAPVEERESDDGLKLWHMTGTGYDQLKSSTK